MCQCSFESKFPRIDYVILKTDLDVVQALTNLITGTMCKIIKFLIENQLLVLNCVYKGIIHSIQHGVESMHSTIVQCTYDWLVTHDLKHTTHMV